MRSPCFTCNDLDKDKKTDKCYNCNKLKHFVNNNCGTSNACLFSCHSDEEHQITISTTKKE